MRRPHDAGVYPHGHRHHGRGLIDDALRMRTRAERRVDPTSGHAAGPSARAERYRCGLRRHVGRQVHTMHSSETKTRFESLLAERGLVLDELQAEQLVEVMLDYYADVRVQDVDDQDDGDMLLFQCGTYDWGSGRSFQYDLTRQVITTEAADDDAIWQLHVTFHFGPTAESDLLGSGNRWCHDPSELGDFTSFIDGSDASAYARSHRPDRVEIGFELAG